ncbi:hypothetical protein D3C87_367660 [compost metagenome]
MKRKLTYLLFLMGMVNQNGFAQTTAYNFSLDTLSGCQSTIGVHLNIGANPETGGVVSVDWGDGNNDTYNYTTATGNTSHYIQVTHGYTLPGNHTALFNVYSGTTGGNVDAGQSVVIPTPGAANCGYLWINTVQNVPLVNYPNVPYLFTDVNNNVTILTPSANSGGTGYTGLNPANAPYTVQIDPSWLASNSLTQTSANFTITAFNPNGMATNPQHTVTVSCNIPSPNPDFGVGYGWASNFVAPLQSGNLYLNICNYACSDTSDVSVSIQMPANYLPNTTGLTNAVVTGNMLTFDITDLSECAAIEIPFTFPGNTPGGTSFCFLVSLYNPDDSHLPNNHDTICGVVLNSYDPNEKLVDLPMNINPDAVEELEYIIHFQNDGNFNAIDVVVQDTISPNLDLSTFRYVGSKHGVAVSINASTRVVTFSFKDINLGQSAVNLASSQGYVVYTISETANLPLGSTIENTAYIYFDFNPPIVTNTTYNINELPLGLSGSKIESISLYPNPAQDKIRFSGAEVKEAIIYDLAGKTVLETSNILDNEVSLNHIQTGIYQVVLKTENTISTQKLVIRK